MQYVFLSTGAHSCQHCICCWFLYFCLLQFAFTIFFLPENSDPEVNVTGTRLHNAGPVPPQALTQHKSAKSPIQSFTQRQAEVCFMKLHMAINSLYLTSLNWTLLHVWLRVSFFFFASVLNYFIFYADINLEGLRDVPFSHSTCSSLVEITWLAIVFSAIAWIIPHAQTEVVRHSLFCLFLGLVAMLVSWLCINEIGEFSFWPSPTLLLQFFYGNSVKCLGIHFYSVELSELKWFWHLS